MTVESQQAECGTVADPNRTTGSATVPRHVFVVLNPVAGSVTDADVRQTLARHFREGDWICEIHETGHSEQLADIVREASARGFDLVVGAGGDGTVSGVADGLVGTPTPLGIIPLGTANVLARELELPVDLDAACALLAGEPSHTEIDAMRVSDHHYFTQVGVGLDALMIRDTARDAKRRFGRSAYLWTALTRLFGLEPTRFRIVVDGQAVRQRASEVLIANVGTLGQPPFRWGPDIRLDDGRLDVCIVRARTLWDYLVLGAYVVLGLHRKAPNVRYLRAERSVSIASKRPMPVQADGEIIRETPIEVVVVPKAVRVVVPAPAGSSD